MRCCSNRIGSVFIISDQARTHHPAVRGRVPGSGVIGLIFRYNNFDLPITTPGPYKQNSCFILQTKTDPVTKFVIDHNCSMTAAGASTFPRRLPKPSM